MPAESFRHGCTDQRFGEKTPSKLVVSNIYRLPIQLALDCEGRRVTNACEPQAKLQKCQ